MRLNSRVAELRKRGHVIVCARADGTYAYTLLDSPGEIERLGPDGSSGESSRDESGGFGDPATRASFLGSNGGGSEPDRKAGLPLDSPAQLSIFEAAA